MIDRSSLAEQIISDLVWPSDITSIQSQGHLTFTSHQRNQPSSHPTSVFPSPRFSDPDSPDSHLSRHKYDFHACACTHIQQPFSHTIVITKFTAFHSHSSKRRLIRFCEDSHTHTMRVSTLLYDIFALFPPTTMHSITVPYSTCYTVQVSRRAQDIQ